LLKREKNSGKELNDCSYTIIPDYFFDSLWLQLASKVHFGVKPFS